MEENGIIKCRVCEFTLAEHENGALYEFLEETGECPECGWPLYYASGQRVKEENYIVTGISTPAVENLKNQSHEQRN